MRLKDYIDKFGVWFIVMFMKAYIWFKLRAENDDGEIFPGLPLTP